MVVVAAAVGGGGGVLAVVRFEREELRTRMGCVGLWARDERLL